MTVPQGAGSTKSSASSTVAGSTWPVLLFALIILGAGLAAMAALTPAVTAGAITALVAAVLGVVGTHVGHVAGHELAVKQSTAQLPLSGLERLTQLHAAGKLSDDEFTAAKRGLLGMPPDESVPAPKADPAISN
jgi:hypothetical protein